MNCFKFFFVRYQYSIGGGGYPTPGGSPSDPAGAFERHTALQQEAGEALQHAQAVLATLTRTDLSPGAAPEGTPAPVVARHTTPPPPHRGPKAFVYVCCVSGLHGVLLWMCVVLRRRCEIF